MHKKLSIVFVTNNYTPYKGGVVSAIQSQRAMLQQQGHIVTIITLDFISDLPQEDFVIRLYCPFQFMYKNNHMAIPFLPSYYIEKHLEKIKPDIIHLHHPFLLGKITLALAKNLRIPTVFTYHTLYDHYLHYIPLPQQITRPFVTKMVHSFCAQVDGIIAPSSAVQKQLEDDTIKTKIRIIPSSIAPIFFSKNNKKRITVPLQLLTVSRFVQEKNIPFLLDLMAELDPHIFHLTLAGYGSEYAALQDYAYGTQNLTPLQIRFIENPSKNRLVQLYQMAHVFVFASQSETQGLVLAEAMAQGTPVVALDGPGQRDIVQNGYNGFLVHNHAEMKDVLERITTDERLYAILQRNAQKTAQQYTAEYSIGRLTEFYYAVMKKRTP